MTACVVCPAPRPRDAKQGLVCDRCSNRILRYLRELEDYLPTLSLLKTTTDQEGRKPGFGSTSPANDTAIFHTDWRTTPSALDGMGAVATIHEWATQLREHRGLPQPRLLTLTANINALRHNHSWIICQDWVDDYAAELREVHAAVRAVAHDPVPKPVGRCITIHAHGECGGDVYELDDASGVRCSVCRRIYSGLDLDRLRIAQEAG